MGGKGRPIQPGQALNPNGRPVGARNRRTVELWDKLEAIGRSDLAEFLASVVDDKNADANLRVTAANALMPYKYSKRGLTSEPVPLVFVETPVELPFPHVDEIAHTIANIEHIAGLRRGGKLDVASADAMVAEQRILRDALVEQAKLIAAQGGPRDQRIVIEGGLPPLPGTDIDIGGQFDARVAAARHPAVINGEHVRDGQIVPTTDAIPPPGWPDNPKPKPDDDPA
jgi:hypothetical protein